MRIRTSTALCLLVAPALFASAQEVLEGDPDELKLVAAIESGSITEVRRLLDAGVSPNSKVGSEPAMQCAIYGGHYYVVKLLIDHGADVNLPAGDGFTPLMTASIEGNAKIARLLLDKGANINAVEKVYGLSALMNACSAGSDEVFDLLVERGADIQHVDKHGGNCLEEAAFNGAKSIVEKLRAKGVKTKWPLHVACGIGDVEQVKKLLAEGADPAQANKGWKNSPMHFAGGGGQLETAKLLKEKGAKLAPKNSLGCTPLHYVAAADKLKFAKWLVAEGADMNAESEDGTTPLNWAGPLVESFLESKGAKLGVLNGDYEW